MFIPLSIFISPILFILLLFFISIESTRYVGSFGMGGFLFGLIIALLLEVPNVAGKPFPFIDKLIVAFATYSIIINLCSVTGLAIGYSRLNSTK